MVIDLQPSSSRCRLRGVGRAPAAKIEVSARVMIELLALKRGLFMAVAIDVALGLGGTGRVPLEELGMVVVVRIGVSAPATVSFRAVAIESLWARRAGRVPVDEFGVVVMLEISVSMEAVRWFRAVALELV